MYLKTTPVLVSQLWLRVYLLCHDIPVIDIELFTLSWYSCNRHRVYLLYHDILIFSTDLDECSESTIEDHCPPPGNCTNKVPGYTCVCPSGYTLATTGCKG